MVHRICNWHAEPCGFPAAEVRPSFANESHGSSQDLRFSTKSEEGAHVLLGDHPHHLASATWLATATMRASTSLLFSVSLARQVLEDLLLEVLGTQPPATAPVEALSHRLY